MRLPIIIGHLSILEFSQSVTAEEKYDVSYFRYSSTCTYIYLLYVSEKNIV